MHRAIHFISTGSNSARLSRNRLFRGFTTVILVYVAAVLLAGFAPGELIAAEKATHRLGRPRFNPVVQLHRLDTPSQVEVYFSKSVDPGYASGEEAQGNINLENKLIECIDGAHHALDVCSHSLTRWEISNSIIDVWDHHVAVRMIVEDDNRDSDQIQAIENIGIPVIDDSAGPNPGTSLMHNKVVVVDYRKGAFEDDDILWTGSYNFTYYGGYKNAENALLIRNHDLCSIYTAEFDEMWGGSGDLPNESVSRFGSRKYDNTLHYFSFDGGVNNGMIFFSPSDGTNDEIEDAIFTADYEIYFCIYNFTRDDIAIALHQRYMWGVDVIGVFDSACVGNPGDCQFDEMTGWGMDVYEDGVSGGGSLHHKYMIIDGFHPDSDPMVITGSHNWTTSGAYYNDENLIILKDPRIANLYIQEFASRLEDAGGHLEIPARSTGDARKR